VDHARSGRATRYVDRPGATGRRPGITEQQRGIILEMMANGSYARIILATADLIAVFERLEASGADVIQEPIEHPSGVRDCAFHDPACNLVRIIERRAVMPIRRRSS
jgi:predicted enzyme related to lactoylglutathione lyase